MAQCYENYVALGGLKRTGSFQTYVVYYCILHERILANVGCSIYPRPQLEMLQIILLFGEYNTNRTGWGIITT